MTAKMHNYKGLRLIQDNGWFFTLLDLRTALVWWPLGCESTNASLWVASTSISQRLFLFLGTGPLESAVPRVWIASAASKCKFEQSHCIPQPGHTLSTWRFNKGTLIWHNNTIENTDITETLFTFFWANFCFRQ